MLDILKVAELLDVHHKTIRRMVQRGELPKPIELQTAGEKKKPLRWFAEEIYEYLDRLKYAAERKTLEKESGARRDQSGQVGTSEVQAENVVEKTKGKKVT